MEPIVLGFFIIGSISSAVGMVVNRIPISIYGGALIIYSAIMQIGGN